MGFLADKTVFSPLTKEILEESISFSCGNEDLDGFFHNDAVVYADNLCKSPLARMAVPI